MRATGHDAGPRHKGTDMTAYRTIDVNGNEIFYREGVIDAFLSASVASVA